MRHEFLSHTLADGQNPVYGGTISLAIHTLKSISRGDSANVSSFTMENHWGTHVDAPNHFFNHGLKVFEYPPEFWFFKHPYVLQVSLEPSEILKGLSELSPQTDLLLIQSNWCKRRHEEVYVKENPGIDPDVGFHLRSKYPHLRAVGIDWISVSPYTNRVLGRLTHRAFLDPDGQNAPIVLIEDMDLSSNLTALREVVVFPLRVEALDSAPCTIVGMFDD
ncbi:cyclase family protein [Candidatus Magnetominusculus xianensis]|uniref:Cyclase family protein n=1 Tax=Candidatus Magnetominusculus xianensis TaxID=1748249 RepID=A0ABR5SIU2_9BACT|nr:cyclase family protein [Candidatus Magnetominusculus xianensis]KWT92840.1 cyclase family protein [Candidatus Magnetominusculus xianensis]MBF0403429.1 cyclase family protein [Nitrospirota bacterium]